MKIKFSKNSKVLNSKKIIFLIIIVLLGYCFVVKNIASTQLGYFSDEPDDYGNLIQDWVTLPDFFNRTASTEQARLPLLIMTPIIAVVGYDFLIPARILDIAIHMGYLCVIYKLFRLSMSRVKALYGLILTALSAYLFSFSIFTMTTSGNIFLLLGTLILYLYLKYMNPQNIKKHISVNILACMGIVSGLAIASRFFSVLILIAVFVYDAFYNRHSLLKNNNYRIWQLPFGKLNIYFIAIFLTVNLLPIFSELKISIMVGLIVYYLLHFSVEYYRKRNFKIQNGFISRWLVIVNTAFVYCLIGSPIHLNINNIIRIFNWSSTWHKAENYMYPSRFDKFTIIGIKTGWLAGLAIVGAVLIIIYRRQLKIFTKTYALFILLVIVHLAVFLKIKYVITWYPIFIMPFVYLPLAYIFPDTKKELYSPIGLIILVVLVFIPLNEQYRYWRLFPYGHIDGAQYGKQYIGWNKPGMITFEAADKIVEYIKENRQTLPPGNIDCRLTKSFKHKSWASDVLNSYFVKANLNNYKCNKSLSNNSADYVISSVFVSDVDIADLSLNYKKVKVFTEANIPIATLWIKK